MPRAIKLNTSREYSEFCLSGAFESYHRGARAIHRAEGFGKTAGRLQRSALKLEVDPRYAKVKHYGWDSRFKAGCGFCGPFQLRRVSHG